VHANTHTHATCALQVVAYEPPAPQQAPPLPVLAYQEIHELPEIDMEQVGRL